MTIAPTEERLTDAIALVAEVIVKHGPQYGPILDRLEQELAALKRGNDPVSRARMHLARVEAIRARQATQAR